MSQPFPRCLGHATSTCSSRRWSPSARSDGHYRIDYHDYKQARRAAGSTPAGAATCASDRAGVLPRAQALSRGSRAVVWLVPGEQQQAPGVIAEVRVHGNHLTPDDEIVKLSGIVIGARSSHDDRRRHQAPARRPKFDDVKCSSATRRSPIPSKIPLVLMVTRGRCDRSAGRSGPSRCASSSAAWWTTSYMPIFDAEDGYGITFGVRVVRRRKDRKRSRISFPFTGRSSNAQAPVRRTFQSGPLSRSRSGR